MFALSKLVGGKLLVALVPACGAGWWLGWLAAIVAIPAGAAEGALGLAAAGTGGAAWVGNIWNYDCSAFGMVETVVRQVFA